MVIISVFPVLVNPQFRRIIKNDPTKNLKIAVIYSYAANEEEIDGILDEENSEDTSALDQNSRDFLESAIQDYNLMFHDFPERIIPYRYDVYAANPHRFESVTTDCVTGKAVYWEEKLDEKRIIDIAKASCSLPFGCPIAYVDGRPMLDGGIADSIPFQRAFSQGYEKVVVVLTRNAGYRKSEKKPYIPGFLYKNYPRLKEAIRTRGQMYNRQLCQLEELERQGKAVVIRPVNPIQVGRMEKNVDKLQHLYDEGYQCAAAFHFAV